MNISHELLTPLTVIAASIEQLREQEPTHSKDYALMDLNVIRMTRLLQQILEIQPLTDITFRVVAHGIKSPQRFEGKWREPYFFNGFSTGILKGKSKFVFLKTKDFEYQTNWKGRKGLKCFPAGDKIHIKFVQEDERCYIQRVPKRSTRIFGTTFFKALTD